MKVLIKKYYKLIILIFIIITIVASPIKNYLNIDEITKFIKGVQENHFAPLIYISIYIVGVVLAVPGTALTIIAAPIFGFWMGLFLVVIGSNLGCQITFFISRLLGKDFVEKFIKSESFVDKTSKKVEENGFLFMIYLRLIPIFPFNGVNYLSGITKVKYRDYTLASFLGMLPGTALYVYLSYTAADIKRNPYGMFISLFALIVFTIILTFIKKRQNRID